MGMNSDEKLPFSGSVASVGTAAMLLAITRTIGDEEAVKKLVASRGFRFVVTEVGGRSSLADFQEKTTKAVIGACLNSGLIKKTVVSIHALLHATEEAKRGILVNATSNTSLATKIAIVRDAQWIAVGIFGESAIHPITNHERAGLGVMHLCDSPEPTQLIPDPTKW